jgi:hypothetical protein
VGTLASELWLHVETLTSQPRIYADANVPAGVLRHMRRRLKWDVLAVIEDGTMRRASDVQHYRTASMLRRTLISLDDDFLDDRQFLPAASAGVIILSAQDERGLARLLTKVDRPFFAPGRRERHPIALPLQGRKIQVHPDWSGPVTTRRRARPAPMSQPARGHW